MILVLSYNVVCINVMVSLGFVHDGDCYVNYDLALSYIQSLACFNPYSLLRTIGGKAARFPGVNNNRYLNAAYNWLPPEIIKGDLSTEKSDIYGFCAVMWEMFTGLCSV